MENLPLQTSDTTYSIELSVPVNFCITSSCRMAPSDASQPAAHYWTHISTASTTTRQHAVYVRAIHRIALSARTKPQKFNAPSASNLDTSARCHRDAAHLTLARMPSVCTEQRQKHGKTRTDDVRRKAGHRDVRIMYSTVWL